MAHVLRGMAAGFLAGLTASWVMNRFQQLRPVHHCELGSTGESSSGPQRQQQSSQQRQAAGGAEEEDATVKTAELISRDVFGHELSDKEKQIAGPVVHYGYGAVIGSIYGGLAELVPVTGAGFGLPFGAALWLLGDEVAVPALGLAKPPTEYPPEVHADALSAHFMYGMTTDILRRVLRHVV